MPSQGGGTEVMMLLDYFMNPDLYTSDVFWQTFLFSAAGLLIAGLLFREVTTAVSHALREKEVSFNPLKMPKISLLFFLIYLLFGTAMIPAAPPAKTKIKTFLSALSVPLFGLAAGFGCVTLYATTSVIMLRSLLLSLATAFVSGGVFSLIPFPGLPGGNIIAALLPEKIAGKWINLDRYLPFAAVIVAGLLARSGTTDAVIAKIIAIL